MSYEWCSARVKSWYRRLLVEWLVAVACIGGLLMAAGGGVQTWEGRQGV